LHFESIHDCIYTLDPDFVCTSVSPSVERLLGYRPEEIVGQFFPALNILAPEYLEKAASDVASVLAGEVIDSTEYEFCAKDGSRRFGEVSGAPLIRDGKVVAVISVARDITERKRMEQELRNHRDHLEEVVRERTSKLRIANDTLEREIAERRQAEEKVKALNEKLEQRVKDRTRELEKAYEELKKLDQMKDDFLSTISHELRTPLTSIRSFSEILLQYDEETPETRREFLEIIAVESERLTRLINDFLDLSKIEAGRMLYEDDVVSLEEIIGDVVKSQSQLLRQKSLELKLDISTELPFIFADRDRIQQVMTNLLGNAIKFSFEGGEIRIRADRFEGKRSGEGTDWLKVSISDKGIGIDPKDFEIIFDKFCQVTSDTIKEKPKGTGLGLPICRQIVCHYGGNIWVESDKGVGSTFSFTLPGISNTPKDIAEPDLPEAEAIGWRGKTILVVDDNANIRKLLRYQLQRRGYTILEACDGNEVLEQARNTHIDLITLDLIMPAMNGYDLLGLIREDPKTKDVPVLIISMVEDKRKGILLGANEYLVKPFRADELAKKVQTLLGDEKRSILVVDDEPAVLETLRMQLEQRGHPVDVACDGEEAVQFLKRQTPDLVILDVVMPKMNGYQLLRWIRNQPQTRHLPVIVLSAYKLSDGQSEFPSLGIDAYIEKSEGLSSLFEKIDSTLLSPGEGS
jgi:PAS domain S-box-containing protein